jgi:site-specific DNA recombinase
MTRAAIYARISSDRDDERLGVDRQVTDCRKLCRERGWGVAGEYVDNSISAADPRKVRPEYQRLLADIRQGKLDAVVVWDADRLHRQLGELVDFVAAGETAGLRLLGSVGGDIDLNDENALMLLQFKVAMAAAEAKKVRKRILRKKLELAERGRYSGGGTRPFGYERDGTTVRESEAELIREAARRVLEGGQPELHPAGLGQPRRPERQGRSLERHLHQEDADASPCGRSSTAPASRRVGRYLPSRVASHPRSRDVGRRTRRPQ